MIRGSWLTSFFLLLFLIQNAVPTEETQQQQNVTQTTPVQPYMNIETSCTSDSLLVVASLEEPFYGVIYAKGYPNLPSCAIDGAGSRVLRLALNVSECGVRFVENESGKRQLDVSLYVQYDRHVQQAVDEQLTVRCSSPLPNYAEETKIPEMLLDRILLKASRRSDSAPEPNKVLQSNRPIVTANSKITPNSVYPIKKVVNAPSGGKLTSSIIKSSSINVAQQAVPQQQDTVSCWMDIVAGTDPTSRPVSTFLQVGEEATLVVKIKQAAGLDTRLTNCVAHDGSHESQQELLDSEGCSVDPSILPNVQERTNLRTGIRLFYASFQAFKFPDRDHLHIKCTVIVCKGKCPNNACRLIRRKGRRDLRAGKAQVVTNPGEHIGKILTGRVGSVRPLTLKEIDESVDVRPTTRLRTNDRLLSEETAGVQTNNSTNRASTSRVNDQQHAAIPVSGSIVDRVDVFNSVQVRAPGQDAETSRASKASTAVGVATAEEAIFCLTPSKLFMAFGILLAILIAAMLFSICVCVKAKAKSRRYCKQSNFAVAPTFAQHQHPQLSPNYVRSPGPIQHPTLHRQQFQSHNSSSTYVRVFK